MTAPPAFQCYSQNRSCRQPPDPDCCPEEVVVWKCGHCGGLVCSSCEGVSNNDLCDACWGIFEEDPEFVDMHTDIEPVEIGCFRRDLTTDWQYVPRKEKT